MIQIFTMRNTSITLAILAVFMMIAAFGIFTGHDANAQNTGKNEGAILIADPASTPAIQAPAGNPVIIPVQSGNSITPEKVENIVLKWIMVLTSLFTAVSAFLVFAWSKILEVRRAMAASETNTNARMERQEVRVEQARNKAEALEVKVEKHLTTCDPLKNPAAHGGSAATPVNPSERKES